MRERLLAIITATAPPPPVRPAADAPRGEQLAWLWRRAQHGWPAPYPMAQFPNAPLLLSFVASWLTGVLAEGDARAYAQAAGGVLLAIWAWLELTAGFNLWRRLIGLTFMVLSIGSLGQLIAG